MLPYYTCAYCASTHITFYTCCPTCGALMAPPIASKAPNPPTPLDLAAALTKICARYEDITCCHSTATLPEKKLRNARQAFVPPEEIVIFLCDDTLFGSNNLGFAVCTGGLYWKNDWATATKRTRLTWAEFVERDITYDAQHYDINLGRGDRIGAAAMGGEDGRARLTALLVEIRDFLRTVLPSSAS